METAELICLMICITVGVIVLSYLIGKDRRQSKRLKHEKEMENTKWAQKMLWEDKRAEILKKKDWFEVELEKIRKEQEELNKKTEKTVKN